MPRYRAYLVDKDGYFHSSIAIECFDDSAARAETMQLIDGHDLELWQSDRKVAIFRHGDKSEITNQNEDGSAAYAESGNEDK